MTTKPNPRREALRHLVAANDHTRYVATQLRRSAKNLAGEPWPLTRDETTRMIAALQIAGDDLSRALEELVDMRDDLS